MQIFESKFTVVTIFLVGAMFGALCGFWATVALVISGFAIAFAMSHNKVKDVEPTGVVETSPVEPVTV